MGFENRTKYEVPTQRATVEDLNHNSLTITTSSNTDIKVLESFENGGTDELVLDDFPNSSGIPSETSISNNVSLSESEISTTNNSVVNETVNRETYLTDNHSENDSTSDSNVTKSESEVTNNGTIPNHSQVKYSASSTITNNSPTSTGAPAVDSTSGSSTTTKELAGSSTDFSYGTGPASAEDATIAEQGTFDETANDDESSDLVEEVVDHSDPDLAAQILSLIMSLEVSSHEYSEYINQYQELLDQIEQDALKWYQDIYGSTENISIEKIVEQYSESLGEEFATKYTLNMDNYKLLVGLREAQKEIDDNLTDLKDTFETLTGQSFDEFKQENMIGNTDEYAQYFGFSEALLNFGIGDGKTLISNLDELKAYIKSVTDQRDQLVERNEEIDKELDTISQEIQDCLDNYDDEAAKRIIELNKKTDELNDEKEKNESTISVLEKTISYHNSLLELYSDEYQKFAAQYGELSPEAVDAYMSQFFDDDWILKDGVDSSQINPVFIYLWMQNHPHDYVDFSGANLLSEDEMYIVDNMTTEELLYFAYLYGQAVSMNGSFLSVDSYSEGMLDIIRQRCGIEQAIERIKKLENYEVNAEDLNDWLLTNFLDSEDPTLMWLATNWIGMRPNRDNCNMPTPEEYEEILLQNEELKKAYDDYRESYKQMHAEEFESFKSSEEWDEGTTEDEMLDEFIRIYGGFSFDYHEITITNDNIGFYLLPEDAMSLEEYQSYYNQKIEELKLEGILKEIAGDLSDSAKNDLYSWWNGIKDGTYDFGEGFSKLAHAFFTHEGYMSEQDYMVMFYAQYLTQHSESLIKWYQNGQSVGMMLPVIASSMIVNVLVPGAGSDFALMLMGSSVMGNTVNQELLAGHSFELAMLYAALSSGKEVLLEKYLGGIFGLAEHEMPFLIAMINEGREEAIGTIMEYALRRIIYGSPIDGEALVFETWDSFVQGALIAGELNAFIGVMRFSIGGVMYSVELTPVLQELYQQGGYEAVKNYIMNQVVEVQDGEISSDESGLQDNSEAFESEKRVAMDEYGFSEALAEAYARNELTYDEAVYLKELMDEGNTFDSAKDILNKKNSLVSDGIDVDVAELMARHNINQESAQLVLEGRATIDEAKLITKEMNSGKSFEETTLILQKMDYLMSQYKISSEEAMRMLTEGINVETTKLVTANEITIDQAKEISKLMKDGKSLADAKDFVLKRDLAMKNHGFSKEVANSYINGEVTLEEAKFLKDVMDLGNSYAVAKNRLNTKRNLINKGYNADVADRMAKYKINQVTAEYMLNNPTVPLSEIIEIDNNINKYKVNLDVAVEMVHNPSMTIDYAQLLSTIMDQRGKTLEEAKIEVSKYAQTYDDFLNGKKILSDIDLKGMDEIDLKALAYLVGQVQESNPKFRVLLTADAIHYIYSELTNYTNLDDMNSKLERIRLICEATGEGDFSLTALGLTDSQQADIRDAIRTIIENDTSSQWRFHIPDNYQTLFDSTGLFTDEFAPGGIAYQSLVRYFESRGYSSTEAAKIIELMSPYLQKEYVTQVENAIVDYVAQQTDYGRFTDIDWSYAFQFNADGSITFKTTDGKIRTFNSVDAQDILNEAIDQTIKSATSYANNAIELVLSGRMYDIIDPFILSGKNINEIVARIFMTDEGYQTWKDSMNQKVKVTIDGKEYEVNLGVFTLQFNIDNWATNDNIGYITPSGNCQWAFSLSDFQDTLQTAYLESGSTESIENWLGSMSEADIEKLVAEMIQVPDSTYRGKYGQMRLVLVSADMGTDNVTSSHLDSSGGVNYMYLIGGSTGAGLNEGNAGLVDLGDGNVIMVVDIRDILIQIAKGGD